jgi:hypothetical protein
MFFKGKRLSLCLVLVHSAKSSKFPHDQVSQKGHLTQSSQCSNLIETPWPVKAAVKKDL